jgi:hypothetical protein
VNHTVLPVLAGRAPQVSIERGGHLFLGHDAEVRKAISAFVASAGPKPA